MKNIICSINHPNSLIIISHMPISWIWLIIQCWNLIFLKSCKPYVIFPCHYYNFKLQVETYSLHIFNEITMKNSWGISLNKVVTQTSAVGVKTDTFLYKPKDLVLCSCLRSLLYMRTCKIFGLEEMVVLIFGLIFHS